MSHLLWQCVQKQESAEGVRNEVVEIWGEIKARHEEETEVEVRTCSEQASNMDAPTSNQ